MSSDDEVFEMTDRISELESELAAARKEIERLKEALTKIIPIAEHGGNFGQVCNGCHANSWEFANHSPDCPVRMARKVLAAEALAEKESKK